MTSELHSQLVERMVVTLRAAFPDLTFEIDDGSREGDGIAIRWIPADALLPQDLEVGGPASFSPTESSEVVPHSTERPSGSYLLDEPLSSEDLLSPLRSYLRGVFASGTPEMKHAARRLGMSTRTLQRRLHRVGTSFTQEVDDTRRELACQLVLEADCPLREIAMRLGFVDVGSFFRAFRRWTQTSPRQYRLRATTTEAEAVATVAS
ncbi:helix-turn-helix domain-containing protein [Pendulispora rubella]|uniref:Helix-turn-helix domain-containing protein n=1 Tax=Pendulispora rubella TaxID=2741070 RepID=A0ABZ2L6F4_9BACT